MKVPSHVIFFSLLTILVMGNLFAMEQDAREFNYGILRLEEDYTFQARLAWGGEDVVVLEVRSGCSCLTVSSLPEMLQTGKENILELHYQPVEEGLARFSVELLLADTVGGQPRWEEWTFVAWVSAEGGHDVQTMIFPKDIPEISPQKLKQNPLTWLLVDIRGTTAYEAMRIPNSLQFDLNDIPYQNALEEQEIVLVDSGWLDRSQQERVEHLRKAGYKLSRISGGLAGWYRAGGEVQGSWISPISLRELSVEKWAETAGEQWELVHVTQNTLLENRRLWGREIPRVALGKMPEQDQEQVMHILEDALRNPQRKAILFIGNKNQRARVLAVLPQQEILPCYFLEEDSESLLQVMNQLQNPVHVPATHRIRSSTSSGAPAPGALHLTAKPSSGKCSTCPGK